MSALRAIIASFSVDVDDKKLDALNQKLSKGIGLLGSYGTALAGAGLIAGLVAFVKGQADAGMELVKTAAMLGITTAELQRFQFAAQSAGLTAEQASNGLRFLNKNVGSAAEGNKAAAQAFAHLGVSVKDAHGQVKPTGELVVEVADGLKKVDNQAERTALAMKVFGRSGAQLLPVLQQGGDAVRELYKDFDQLGGGLSEEFTEKAQDAYKANVRFQSALTGLSNVIGIITLPVFKSLLDTGTEWIRQMAESVGKSSAVQTALAMITGAAVIMAAALLAPWIPAILMVGVLFLVLEDLWTMMRGGKSVTGEWLESFAGVEGKAAVIDGIRKSYELLTSAVREAVTWVKIFAEGDFGHFKSGEKLSKDQQHAVDIASGDELSNQADVDRRKAIDKGLHHEATIGPEELGPPVAPPVFTAGARLKTPPPAAVTPGNVNAPQTNNISVNVQGASDPRATGRAVALGVQQATDHLHDTLAAISRKAAQR